MKDLKRIKIIIMLKIKENNNFVILCLIYDY